MSDQVALTDLGDGLFVGVNGSGEMGRSNSAVLIEDGVATVVDTMLLPRMNAVVREEIARRGATVATVLNTHQHVDHMGGNVAFPGARALAHPRVVEVATQMAEDMGFMAKLMPAFADEVAELDLVLPTAADPADWPLPGGARTTLFHSAHSIVDVAILLPEQRTVLAADLCFNGVTPMARHGSVSGWVGALDELIAFEPDVVVPGHGPLGDVHTLHALRDYFAAVLETASGMNSSGVELDDAVAQFPSTVVGEWLEPARTRLNLQVAAAELAGTPLPLGPPK